MRHVTLLASIALATWAGGFGHRALATPFEPATIPDQVQAVGHLDVDALRGTQLFAAADGQAAIDHAIDNAPQHLRKLARSLAGSVRGISFWRGADHGAIYVETRDGRALAKLLAKVPSRPAAPVEGYTTYAVGNDDGKSGLAVACGDTLVLADSEDSLALSLRALNGKVATLAGSSKLPAASRHGMFVFVTIGDDLLSSIQKAAQSQMLQLGLRSVALDVSESGGQVIANARGELRTADEVLRAKALLDTLRTLASLSDDPEAKLLLSRVTVTTSGLAVELVARLPVAEAARLLAK